MISGAGNGGLVAAIVWNRAVVGDDCKRGADLNNAMFLPASQPFLRVNARGERFMNEDSTYPEIFAQGQHQPGGYSWRVSIRRIGTIS